MSEIYLIYNICYLATNFDLSRLSAAFVTCLALSKAGKCDYAFWKYYKINIKLIGTETFNESYKLNDLNE